jgi:hypothetical protein
LISKSLPPNPIKDEPFVDIHLTFFSPEFYQGAVFAGQGTNKARHLLFFTPVMKRQLEDCKTWFMYSTFHFIRLPFAQVKLKYIFKMHLKIILFYLAVFHKRNHH